MTFPPALIDSLSTPLLLVDRAGRVLLANTAAGQFWRSTPARLRDARLQRLFSHDERVALAALRAVEGEASTTITGVRLEPAADDPVPPELHAQVDPVLVPGRPVEQAVVVIWDLSNLARLQTAEREQRQVESLTMMVQRLAHELQNPLSGIKGATQLLARKLGKAPDVAEFPDVILRELERLERLIRNMLGFGPESQLAPVSFNLHELLDEVVWFVANSGAGVNLHRDYDPSLPDLRADRDRLHQVLLNLLRNAADASPPGGTVALRTDIVARWQAREPLPDPARSYFRIEVEDEGPGVAEELRSQLFTPFFTTKHGGTGLGLAISYRIVRAHGGVLRYRPAAGQGAVFSVLLPLADD